MKDTNYIPLGEAWVCPECELIRRGPGPCACGNTETAPISRTLLHAKDRRPVVCMNPVRFGLITTGTIRRAS